MEQIADKLIEIHVTDSSVAVPGTGLFGGLMDNISANPAWLIVAIALLSAMLSIIVAFILYKRHSKHARKPLYILPFLALATTALAIPPMTSLADDSNRLNNSPISITIDKNHSLTADDTTTVTLHKNATDYAEIFSRLTTDFDGKLGDGIKVSVQPVSGDFSAVDLSTVDSLIYTTPGAITAGTDIEFDIIVEIDENLPVGDYNSEVDFYGNYIMAEEFKFTVDTHWVSYWDNDKSEMVVRYEDDDDLAAKAFSMPTSGLVGKTMPEYNWLINCDSINNPDDFIAVSGIALDYHDNPLICEYTEPGEYQITIRPNGEAIMGWMDAFATCYNESESADSYMITTIDTPLTDNMRTRNTSHRFAGMFNMTYVLQEIPSDIFAYIDTTGDTNFLLMFSQTFNNSALTSLDVGIPAELFSTIDTSSAENMNGMFDNTFHGYAKSSLEATIPAGLFSSISISEGDRVIGMFTDTFSQYAHSSKIATIPSGLFATINTTDVTGLNSLFSNTFSGYAYSSEVATIPSGLFDSIDTQAATELNYTFRETFYNYCYSSSICAIPANLFNSLDVSNATTKEGVLDGSFCNFASANQADGINDTDINTIWGGANLSGIMASEANTSQNGGIRGVFDGTFQDMPSLVGSAQDFIDNYLSFVAPEDRAYTFTGTNVIDLDTLAINWK